MVMPRYIDPCDQKVEKLYCLLRVGASNIYECLHTRADVAIRCFSISWIQLFQQSKIRYHFLFSKDFAHGVLDVTDHLSVQRVSFAFVLAQIRVISLQRYDLFTSTC